MHKLGNTIYITADDAFLRREHDTMIIEIGGEKRAQLPLVALDSVCVFGYATISPFLTEICTEKGICISIFSPNGKFLARLEGGVCGNVLLRRAQFRLADDPNFCLDVSQSMVAGKIANCRTVLERFKRDNAEKIDCSDIERVSALLKNSLQSLKCARTCDEIRGIEGESAALYFSIFDKLITAKKNEFSFEGRTRRPPKDPVNAVLSYCYTLLLHDCISALEGVGLDPAVGFLHRDRPGRMSLALDLMEEFRPILSDRMALTLINLQQIDIRGFRKTESGAVEMSDETRKKIIVTYQERKREAIMHPFYDERVEIGLLPHLQARLLARRIRHDAEGYPPFLWK